jgi:serine phosphatase RsbU (regulator of sigma subunit)
MFVTVWAAVLDYATGELTYVNAAHNPPLLRHGGKWEWLKERCGLFLGTFETAKYRQQTLTLEPGDELVLYTDGVNEAFSAEGEQYGDDRLEAACAHALPKVSSPRYKHLKAILDSGLDEPPTPSPTRKKPGDGPGSGPKGHVRGADYYRN